jgi:hypothetical protein
MSRPDGGVAVAVQAGWPLLGPSWKNKASVAWEALKIGGLSLRRGVVLTLVSGAAIGVVIALTAGTVSP